ncbi:MAG: TetR/AcrR family transcriptional regulator, partial [Coprobacillaceae bacterium]
MNSENKIVKDSLTESLLLLMETKEYSQISITDIAKKAGVSRMAYYRNFDNKEDILEYYFDRSCYELYASTNFSINEPFVKSALQYIYTFFIEKQAVVVALK